MEYEHTILASMTSGRGESMHGIQQSIAGSYLGATIDTTEGSTLSLCMGISILELK